VRRIAGIFGRKMFGKNSSEKVSEGGVHSGG
jgi:hypothetical protein